MNLVFFYQIGRLTISTMDNLTRANGTFALDLYRALSAGNPAGNMFFSPLSVSAALSMVYLGARGSTAKEMSEVSLCTKDNVIIIIYIFSHHKIYKGMLL